jgi:hypothetical protein
MEPSEPEPSPQPAPQAGQPSGGKPRFARPGAAGAGLAILLVAILTAAALLAHGVGGRQSVAGALSATATATPTLLPTDTPLPTPTSTPLPTATPVPPTPVPVPTLTFSPQQVRVSNDGHYSGCYGEQVITNTGSQSVSWAWTAGTLPDHIGWVVNGRLTQNTYPHVESMAPGSSVKLALYVGCTTYTPQTYPFTVTDSHGAHYAISMLVWY